MSNAVKTLCSSVLGFPSFQVVISFVWGMALHRGKQIEKGHGHYPLSFCAMKSEGTSLVARLSTQRTGVSETGCGSCQSLKARTRTFGTVPIGSPDLRGAEF